MWTESISGPGVELFFFLVAALVLRFGFRVRIKLFGFFTAKFNKGYKFLKLCRTRFGTKEGQEGTPREKSCSMSQGYLSRLLCRLWCEQDSGRTGRSWGRPEDASCGVVWGYSMCWGMKVLREHVQTPSFVSSEPRCSQSTEAGS